MDKSVVNWVKGLVSSTESTNLLTSEGNNSITTVAPETNATTLLGSTLLLGVFAASFKWKGKEQGLQLDENLLPPNKQSMMQNGVDEQRIKEAIKKFEEKYPDTYIDEVSLSSNETKLQK